ncbi:transposase [Nonomuraea sp. M3C6]|uniref:Transposase n=1 Tax=Nonomuraea marmarensis TaxID=3351344 RepID=A0ABW7AWA3_9ACTN
MSTRVAGRSRAGRHRRWEDPAQVARDFGLVAETVRNWVKAEQSKNSGTTEEARAAIDRARLQEMERRVQELEQENAFLKKAAAFFAKELP